MRELSLAETSYLAALLLLSLVLPLLMSFLRPQDAATRRRCIAMISIRQTIGAAAALGVLVSATVAPYAAAFGAANCLAFAVILLRKFSAKTTV